MSHSSGEVFAEGKRIGWFEYNGTVDVAWPRIFATSEELSENWRNNACQPWHEECDHPKTPAIVFAHYGGGGGWESECCTMCMRITGSLEPSYPEIGRDDPRLPAEEPDLDGGGS